MSTDNPYASPTMPASAIREVPRLEPPQSVSFQRSREDFLHASELATKQSFLSQKARSPWFLPGSFTRRTSLLFAVLSVLAAVRYTVWSWEFLSLASVTALLFFTDNLVLYLIRVIARRITAYRLDKDGQFEQESEIQAWLLQAGFESTGPHGPIMQEWSSIAKIVSDEQMLLIYLDPMTLQVIPAHAFPDDLAFESYCQLAKRLWHEAHGNDTTAD